MSIVLLGLRLKTKVGLPARVAVNKECLENPAGSTGFAKWQSPVEAKQGDWRKGGLALCRALY